MSDNPQSTPENCITIFWKRHVQEYMEYVSEDTYRISFGDDSCTFRQFDASRMMFYGFVIWNRKNDVMTVEMFNPHVNRIVEKILRDRLFLRPDGN